MQDGQIVKALSGFYYVQPHTGGNIIVCKARGLFKKQGVSPLVGDRVRVERKEGELDEGTVVEVHPRTTEMVRPPIANVDTALIVFAVTRPELNDNLLDKFLVHAELAGLNSIICLTKADLLNGAGEEKEALRTRIAALRSLYEAIGYPVFTASVEVGDGLDLLRDQLEDRVTVIAGQSGVGKSSLLNRLAPGLTLETNEISEKLGRGKHTTRHVELFRVGRGGLIADTPGFSQLEFPEMEPERLSSTFLEFAELAEGCKFRGCLHMTEPGCRVTEALHSGNINPTRYEHYQAFLTEIKERKRRY